MSSRIYLTLFTVLAVAVFSEAYETPDYPRNVCPSSDIVYNNNGKLYSPGYPGIYTGIPDLVCQYHLQVAPGDSVVFEITKLFVADGSMRIYEGWSNSKENLLKKMHYGRTAVSTKTTNKMLVEFDMSEFGGSWTAEFYSTKLAAEPGTGVTPGVATTLFPQTANCPEPVLSRNETTSYYISAITSSNFPFGYDSNADCTYYFLLTKEMYFFDAQFPVMNLGKDDRFDLIDLRTNTVFKSSDDSDVQEGFAILVPYSFAIRFRSGREYGRFNHWQTFVDACIFQM